MNKNVNENLRSVDQYEILRELGRGGTSIVYLVADRADGKNYAMKVLRRDDGSNPEDLQEAAEQLWAEAAVLELLGRDPQKQAARDSQKQAGRDPQKQTGSGTGKSTLEKSSREKRDIERQDIEKSGCEERIHGKGIPTFIDCVWKGGRCSRFWRKGNNSASAKRRKQACSCVPSWEGFTGGIRP